jgi:hypothetical protein
LAGEEVLDLPEIGVDIPVAAFYESVDFNGTATAG